LVFVSVWCGRIGGQFWLNLQTRHDIDAAADRIQADLDRITPIAA
jgi:plasmid maintenance system antidote protein VapI